MKSQRNTSALVHEKYRLHQLLAIRFIFHSIFSSLFFRFSIKTSNRFVYSLISRAPKFQDVNLSFSNAKNWRRSTLRGQYNLSLFNCSKMTYYVQHFICNFWLSNSSFSNAMLITTLRCFSFLSCIEVWFRGPKTGEATDSCLRGSSSGKEMNHPYTWGKQPLYSFVFLIAPWG